MPIQWTAYGLKPSVWGRVVPGPRAELQVDPARGPKLFTWPVIVHAGDFFWLVKKVTHADGWLFWLDSRSKKSPAWTGDFFDWATWFLLVFSKWDIGNTSLCVASPEQANSHSSDASYHGEQGYNKFLWLQTILSWLVVGGSVLPPDIHRVVWSRLHDLGSSVVVVLFYSSAFGCCRRLAERWTGVHISAYTFSNISIQV